MKILTVRCSKCGAKIFRYLKVGEGQLWHCWKNRILEDYSIHDGEEIRCRCGSLIGVDVGVYIKLRRKAVYY